MTATDCAGRPAHDDRRLVDLVGTALTDPDMHTDTRMRLHRELTELLRRAHPNLPETGEGDSAPAEGGAHLPSLLERVLVDPNLHTDVRLRLHREIQEILRHHSGS